MSSDTHGLHGIVEGANRNFEIFDPLDCLAAVTSHIPNRGEHLVRYYGYYSSVQRGRRRRQGREKLPLGPPPLSDDTAPTKATRAPSGAQTGELSSTLPLVIWSTFLVARSNTQMCE